MSGDGIDAVSKAADESTGEIPTELLDLVGGLEPDQAARVVEEYLEERTTADDANAAYRAQMNARRARRYALPASGSDPVLAGVGIEGPDAVIDRIWSLISTQADTAYHDDGGRDRPVHAHASLPHRRFDAATDLPNLALLCGTCHRRVHDSRQTLFRQRARSGSVVWATRPATEVELPPPTPLQRE